MELSKQVCSLELAKKLKELGVEQESLFYWEMEQANDNYGVKHGLRYGKIDGAYELIPAYTVAELGEMLLKGYKSYKCDYEWACEDWNENLVESAKTEADARAKMVIYLKEKGII